MKNINLLLLFIIINLISYYIILPYAQQTANSHMNAGPPEGIIYFIISAIIFSTGVYKTYKQKKYKPLLISFIYSVNLIYWGYTLYNLFCQGCANGG